MRDVTLGDLARSNVRLRLRTLRDGHRHVVRAAHHAAAVALMPRSVRPRVEADPLVRVIDAWVRVLTHKPTRVIDAR